MANETIVRICKERLIRDSKQSLQFLFLDESWRAQPMGTYLGANDEGEKRIKNRVGLIMNAFLAETGQTLDGNIKKALKAKINSATLVHKADDPASAIELMTTAATFARSLA